NQSGWLSVTPVALKNRRTKRPNIDRYACSHRARDARRGPSLRRRAGAGTGRPFASWGAGATSRSSRGRLPTVLERGGLELDLPLELLDDRLARERHLVPDDLIRPVLPRGLDRDRVRAGGEGLALVVLAVPDDLVPAGRAGGPGHREDLLGLVDELADL